MKQKMLQLLVFFLLISLFGSSKENEESTKNTCNVKCIREAESAPQGGTNVETANAKDVIAEYPFALSPGSYMLRY